MKREHAFRVATGSVAGVVALLAAVFLLAAAVRWSDVSASDLAVALYVAFGAQQIHVYLVVVGSAILAAALGFLLLARDANRWKGAILQAVALGLVIACGVIAGTMAGWFATTPDWQGEVSDTRWWLTDRTPPDITLDAPAAPVRGPATINITTSDLSETSMTQVTVDGKPVTPAAQIILDTSALLDGEHTVIVQAEDASRQHNRAEASVVFRSETQWWMTDSAPPAITLTVPVTVVQGIAAIALATSDQGEHHVTLFTLDGMALPVAPTVNVDTTVLPDGQHTIIVEAEDASRQRNKAQARAVFRTDNNAPVVSVRFDPPVATQGHTQFVYVSVSEPVNSLTATLASRPLTLARGSDSYWSVVGFEADAKTGTAALAVRAVDLVGNATQVTATQVITRFAFSVENITGEDIALPADRAALLDYGVTETTYLDSVFAPVTPEQLWQGPFMAPVQGPQTSSFAIRRSYNGGPLGSYHGGVDIAANEGVPVPAANRGRVVLAEGLKVRGHAVCLDHGMGVYTCYYHLSQIKVQKGQMVEKGQIIGLVGSEGVSTGPHLHWEMRVSGKAVDPWPWTQRVYP